MRCPKCGYISFDFLEKCKKCGKNLAKVSAVLGGAVHEAMSPPFLQLDEDICDEVSDERDQSIAPDIALSEEDTVEIDMTELDDAETEERMSVSVPDEEDAVELVLDDDVPAQEAGGPDVDADQIPETGEPLQDDMEEDSFLEETGQSPDVDPRLDFSEIDISDLKPPGEQEQGDVGIASDTVVKSEQDESIGMEGLDSALADLELDELGLEDRSSAVGKRTASTKKITKDGHSRSPLDDFDYDLGDLL